MPTEEEIRRAERDLADMKENKRREMEGEIEAHRRRADDESGDRLGILGF